MIERAQLKNLPDAGHEKNQAKHQPREEHRPRAIKRIVCGLFHHLSKRPTPHAVAALPLLTALRPTSAVLAEGVTSTVATVEGFCALTTTVSANAAATKLNPNDLMSMQSSAAGVEQCYAVHLDRSREEAFQLPGGFASLELRLWVAHD